MENILPKIALAFPGVGSQHTMMVKSFYDNSKIAKDIFEEASDISKINIKEICFSNEFKNDLNNIDMSQLALLVASIAVFRTYELEIGIKPDYCLGHSLGEYSALCASGVIKFSDAIEIVQQRGRIIKEAVSSCNGTMMWVINLENKIVEKICMDYSKDGERIFVSAYDSPLQCSISGDTGAMVKLAKKLEEHGAIVYPLKMSGPFHSPLMNSAAKEMKSVLSKYTFRTPNFTVISNYNALPYSDENSVVENLSKQLESTIRWTESIEYLVNSNVKIAIEIGPKDVLQFLIKKNTSEINAFSFNDYALIDNFKKRFIIDREQTLSLIARCLKIAVSTKNYNDDYDDYKNGAILPYKEIEAIYEEMIEKNQYPDRVQVEKAIRMVISVLDTKKVPDSIRKKSFARILEGKILSYT